MTWFFKGHILTMSLLLEKCARECGMGEPSEVL